MANNKVEFGISNLHIFSYDVADNGTVTLGTPYHLPGAIGFSPEQDSNDNVLYADDMSYWSEYSEGPFKGDLEVALFPDDFKTKFLGYKRLTDGGLAAVKNAIKKNVCIAFDIKGDKEGRRACFWNCSLGSIKRAFETIEENKEPATETMAITCVGDNASGATKVTYKPDDLGYDTLFSNPSAPEVESES